MWSPFKWQEWVTPLMRDWMDTTYHMTGSVVLLKKEPSRQSLKGLDTECTKGGIILQRKRRHLEWIVTVLCCLFTLK